MKTIISADVDSGLLNNYFDKLVNHFFKILPIRETNETTLSTYVRSLQIEITGCKNLVEALNYDASIITLLSILQFFIDYPDTPTPEVKREVFKAIGICNRLKARFGEGVVTN